MEDGITTEAAVPKAATGGQPSWGCSHSLGVRLFPMGWVLGVLPLPGVILLFVGVQSYSVLAGGAGQG